LNDNVLLIGETDFEWLYITDENYNSTTLSLNCYPARIFSARIFGSTVCIYQNNKRPKHITSKNMKYNKSMNGAGTNTG